MSDFKCPFCESDKLKIERPEVDRFGEKIFDYCCNAQKTNAKFIDKRYHKTRGEIPDLEEVSEL